MKPNLADLPDEEYDRVVNQWEEYAGISTSELMERYDTTEADSITCYAKEKNLLTLEQYYHLYDCTWELGKYLIQQDDFREVCSCDNLEWALDMFVCRLENEMMFDNINYFILKPDMATSHLAIDTPTDRLYLNLDEIWAYWVGLNKDNYFEA